MARCFWIFCFWPSELFWRSPHPDFCLQLAHGHLSKICHFTGEISYWKWSRPFRTPCERILISSLKRGTAKPPGTPGHKMVPAPWGGSGHVGAEGLGAAIPGGASGACRGSRRLGMAPSRGGAGERSLAALPRMGWVGSRAGSPGSAVSRSAEGTELRGPSLTARGGEEDGTCPAWGEAAPGGASDPSACHVRAEGFSLLCSLFWPLRVGLWEQGLCFSPWCAHRKHPRGRCVRQRGLFKVLSKSGMESAARAASWIAVWSQVLQRTSRTGKSK